MFIKIFVQIALSGLLLCSCSNKKEDFSKEPGKYFIHSLESNNNIIQNRILNVQEKQPFIEYNISGTQNRNIQLVSEPVFIENDIITLNDSGELMRVEIQHSLKIKWKNKFFAQKEFCSNMSLAVKENLVIATCGTNVVKAFDIHNGKEIWNTILDTAISSKPVFTNDFIILFAKNDAAYALKFSTGELLWFIPSIANINHKTLTPNVPVIVQNKIIQQTASDQVRSINVSNGGIEWTMNIGNTIEYTKGKEFLNAYNHIVVEGNNIYCVNSDGAVVKLKIGSYTLNWAQNLMISGELMLLDDKIIGINDLGQIIAISKSSGKTIWINNLNDKKKSTEPYNAVSYSKPIEYDGKIIVLSSNNRLMFIHSENGGIVETRSLNAFGQPFVYNNKIYVLTNNGGKLIEICVTAPIK